MTADILLYNSDIVPVGADQKQHVEFARDIAGYFNKIYGNTFKMPEPVIGEETGLIPGLDGRKMSKSYDNIIPLFAPEKELKKKIMRIITDSKLPEDKKDPEESTIYQLYKHFAKETETAEFAEMFRAGGMGYGTAKTILFEKINSVLSAPRAEYERLMANTDEIDAILADGAKRASVVASETLARVKKAMLG
jgi:tryptophanyl-tRNA synthetase